MSLKAFQFADQIMLTLRRDKQTIIIYGSGVTNVVNIFDNETLL